MYQIWDFRLCLCEMLGDVKFTPSRSGTKFSEQGACPEPIRHRLRQQSRRHDTQKYSWPVPEKTLFIVFVYIEKTLLHRNG